MEKRWLVKNTIDRKLVEEFRSTLKIDDVVAELLLQRGITSFEEAENFFVPKLEDLHSPFLMKDLKEAVLRINQAMANNERILFFGDYDVDGTTAVSLMISFFRNHYANIDYYIPDRYKEGYGVSKAGIDFAKETNVGLLIALDCGIKSVELVSYAKSIGIDFIVCDHHTPGEQLPDCLVLDPKRKDCEYPYKELCGCGVGFKLLQGLCIENTWNLDKLYEHLDLVAVAIGADIVPVTGENRILCYHGIRLLNEQPRASFKTLLTLAKRSFPVTLTDVVFTIAPRINAAGRLHTGRHAVDLMISENLDEIKRMGLEINEYNADRRELDEEITREALEIIANNPEYSMRKSTVVFQENWHKGVVGIVASRIIEQHFKPTIVLTENDGLLTGSARTVNDFDIYSAIHSCEHLLEQFGGHTHAAGLTLRKDNLEAFIDYFDVTVKNSITVEDLSPEEIIDLELNFNDIFTSNENRMKVPKLKRILKKMEPHGPGNMKPVFISRNVFSTDVRILKEKHLKLKMTQVDSDVIMEGIGFNLADKEAEVAAGIPFDIVYTLETNVWNDRETLQMNIKDLRAVV